jgi:hypothetical protein
VLYQLSYFRNNSLSKNYIHFVFGTSNGGAKLNEFFISTNKIVLIFLGAARWSLSVMLSDWKDQDCNG